MAWVDVTIRDAAGTLALQVTCPSPWLLANLPAGRYQLSAMKQGLKPHKVRIRVGGEGQTTVVVRFADLGES